MAAALAVSTAAAPAWAAGQGTIQGTFTSDSGEPLEAASVSVFRTDGEWVGDGLTDGAGHYSIPDVPATGVQLQFQEDSVTQWAHGATRPEDAQTFTVVSGRTLTVDERQLPLGTVSGHLTELDGTPAAFLMVNAHNLDTDQTTYGFAGEDGAYSFGVLPGEYRVSFVRGSGEQWAYQAADATHGHVFTVAAGQTLVVDDTLLPTGSLGGTLTGVDGAPLADAEVDLYRGGQPVSSTFVFEGGYAFDGLLPGDYQVSFRVNDVTQWVKGKRSQADATTYPVVAGQNTVADDSVLPPSVLRGRLTDSTGAALARYHVRAERALPDGHNEYFDATTGTDGSWRIQGALDGSYLVSFQTPDFGRTQWVPGKGSAADATPVAVAAGTTVTVDETWQPGATLVVTAADAVTGAPLTGFCVWVVNTGTDDVCTTGTTATVKDLPSGVFPATVSPQPPTYYLQSGDVPVTLVAGQSTSVSIPVRQGGRVAVTMTDLATGRPVRDACISLRPLGGGGVGEGNECSEADGKISTVPTTPGTYEMFVTAPGQYGDQWAGPAGGTGDQRAAERIVVQAGATAQAPTVLLDKAGSISGVVTGPDAKPIAEADVSIQAWDYGFGPGYDTHTGANGRYTLTGLGPYAWPLAFTADDLPRQWSGRVANRFDAEAVPVTAGATTGYDMALAGGTTIHGKVTVGRPFESWRITAVDPVTGDPMGVFDCYAGCDGTYAMPLVGGQQIKIRYDVSYGEGDNADGWWNDAAELSVPVDGRTLDMTLG